MKSCKTWHLKGLATLVFGLVVSMGYASETLEQTPCEETAEGYGPTQCVTTTEVETKSACRWTKGLGCVLMYVPNRVFDLIDVARLSVSSGPPGAINIRATKHLWWGVSELHVRRVGLIGKRFAFYEKEHLHDECGFNFLDIWRCGCSPRPPYEVGVDVHCLTGIRAAIDLSEVVDFAGGFIFLDPKHDDYCGWMIKRMPEDCGYGTSTTTADNPCAGILSVGK